MRCIHHLYHFKCQFHKIRPIPKATSMFACTNHEETFCFVSSNMTLSYQVTGADKDQLVTSLAAIILSDCGADISADAINSVLSASGNTVPAYYPTLYASYIEKAGGLEKFFAGPSAGAGESYFKFCLCFF